MIQPKSVDVTDWNPTFRRGSYALRETQDDVIGRLIGLSDNCNRVNVGGRHDVEVVWVPLRHAKRLEAKAEIMPEVATRAIEVDFT